VNWIAGARARIGHPPESHSSGNQPLREGWLPVQSGARRDGIAGIYGDTHNFWQPAPALHEVRQGAFECENGIRRTLVAKQLLL
jgi:hypothetical protein